MAQNLKENERELIKLINFFRKRAEVLIKENKMDEEYRQLIEACEKLVGQLIKHAENRAEILLQREALKTIIKDNAVCPKCHKSNQLKFVGIDKNEKGWKSNKYKCRRCNIEFVLNRPNNPWDMVLFMEMYIKDLEEKIESHEVDEATKEHSRSMITQMNESMAKLKPVIEASDLDYQELRARELEMDEMIHNFKNHLLIERIKMDTWENRQNLN
jgi:hypothetical protein